MKTNNKSELLGCWWASEIAQNLNGCRLFIDKQDAMDTITEEMKEDGYRLIETQSDGEAVGLEFKKGTEILLWVFAFVEVE